MKTTTYTRQNHHVSSDHLSPLHITHFKLQEEFYKQIDGGVMGSLLSSVIVNIYMEGLEEEALNTAVDQPSFSLWVCYMNETFCHFATTASESPPNSPCKGTEWLPPTPGCASDEGREPHDHLHQEKHTNHYVHACTINRTIIQESRVALSHSYRQELRQFTQGKKQPRRRPYDVFF